MIQGDTSEHGASLELDHVGICVQDLDAAVELYALMLGARPQHFADDEQLDCRWARVHLPTGPSIELVTPRGDTSPYRAFLDERGPGLHHVSFRIDDLERHAARMRRLDLPIIGMDDDHAGWQELLIHPEATFGALVHFAVPPPSH